MPAPPPLPGNGQGNRGGDLLEQVELLSFTATPDHIVPFATSTLRWQIKSPRGVTLYLLGFESPVPPDGHQAVQPTEDSDFVLQARALQAETTLGTVTVFVDTSLCSETQCTDCALLLSQLLRAGFISSAQAAGHEVESIGMPPTAISISAGLIAYDLTTTTKQLSIHIEVTGSFGLTVDRAADQLAPVAETHNVQCTADAGTWAQWIAAGAGAGALVGAGLSAIAGGVFGLIAGGIWGAIVGGVTSGATLSWLLNSVSDAISAAMPAGIQSLVWPGLSTVFPQQDGKAMAAVHITPDDLNPPDGNITVTFCPKPSSGGRGGVLERVF